MSILQRPQPLFEQVYNYLKDGILNGQYKDNPKVNEANLARELNLSRGPIREAVRMLEMEGLLIRDEKNQLCVYQPAVEDIIDIYQIRQALESLAAQLAAKNIDESQKKKMKNILEELEKLIHSEHSQDIVTKQFAHFSGEFHNEIFLASGNRILKQQLDNLRTLTYFYRHYNAKGEKRRDLVISEHTAIYEAIANHDVVKAGELMKTHIEHDLTHLKQIFE